MKTLSFRLALPLLLGAGLSARAQDFVGEASRYSQLQFGGPARTQGIAGANVALGADFGNLTSNPAGLGLYQKSEINFAPGLGFGQADASGTGTPVNQTKNSFHIASAGLVLARRRTDDDANDWRGGSFALGFSRLADYNTSFSYEGTVADNASLFQRLREPRAANGSTDYESALDDIYDQALNSYNNGSEYTSLDGLAYSTFLTNFSPDKSTLNITPGLRRNPTLAVPQRETITRSGSLSQFDLGYGANYRDRVYVGGGIGIVSANNRVTRTYEEGSNSADTSAFQSLRLLENERTTATGINLRLGIIYRMNDFLRVGASVQTPTYIGLSNTFNQTLETYFKSTIVVPDYVTQSSASSTTGATTSAVPAAYDYAIVTPFRANGGVALTIGKAGFLTGDIEYVGYGQARYHSTPEQANGTTDSFSAENSAIKADYQNAINLRFGGELRLAVFRLRAGYAHYGDPYRNGSIDRSQTFYTAGAGLRQNNFFLDVAGVYTTFDQLYSPYSLSQGREPVITVNNSRFTTNVTAGFTF